MSISVVMPTYERASMINRALESVARQTYPDIEVVVVNDGSTDETRSVVATFSASHSVALTYIEQENCGCAAARNRGLQAAKGDLLTFLDTDDVWLPTAAESLSEALLVADADFVYSPAVEVYADGSERLNYPVAAGQPERFAREHFLTTNVRNGAFLFRRHVLTDVGGLDEALRYNEDSDFIQRIAIRYRAAYCDKPTVRVYHHEGSKSRNRVGIYHALITSAERVLAGSPDFRTELGATADRRLRELRSTYVEQLVIAGEHDEAAAYAASFRGDVGMVAGLAARTRSTVPLEIRDRLVALRRSVGRKPRYIARLLRRLTGSRGGR